jgi:hypothetical protein
MAYLQYLHRYRLFNAELEIAGCQWPKAGHILKMAGKNKFELPSKKNGR